MKKENFFLYPIEFLDEVMSNKFYFTERIGPTLRAIMHKRENIKLQFKKDKKYFFSRLSCVKREKTKKKLLMLNIVKG